MTIAPDLPRLLTAREAADHLRITPDHLYRLVARGVLPAIRFTKGGVLRFRPADLQAALSDPVCGCGEQAETVTIEKENSDEIEIDSFTAEVLEAEDCARLAREEQEEREAHEAWPAFCATMQIEEAP